MEGEAKNPENLRRTEVSSATFLQLESALVQTPNAWMGTESLGLVQKGLLLACTAESCLLLLSMKIH